MKNKKIISFLLACVMLACSLAFSVSAEEITFKPVVSGDKIYGIPAGTTVRTLNNVYYNTIIDVYDLEGNRVAISSQKTIGTGFVVKLNRVAYTAVVMGDVDGDGQIRALDCLKVKRAYLETGAALSSLQKETIGIKNNGEIRAIHYIKLRRACLGTYDINGDYTCAPYDPSLGESGWTSGWV